MKDLNGKYALVTGAASGIGRAIALSLSREGTNLFLVDINATDLATVADSASKAGVSVLTQTCDLAEKRQIGSVVECLLGRWGKLDILVNNAGMVYWGPTVNMTSEQWDRMLAVNLLAPIELTRLLLPTLLEQPEAHLVNVASLFGLVTTRRSCAYHTTKFGLVGFSESLRTEFRASHLGVSTICPGFVTTNLFTNGISGREGKEVPIPPRWICTTPERVARKVLSAIHRKRRLVVMTPFGHLWYQARRLAPGFVDFLFGIGRRRRPTPKSDAEAGAKAAA
jgi:3-oxoacyl-[acyl-carrier protein] reductase